MCELVVSTGTQRCDPPAHRPGRSSSPMDRRNDFGSRACRSDIDYIFCMPIKSRHKQVASGDDVLLASCCLLVVLCTTLLRAFGARVSDARGSYRTRRQLCHTP